MDRAMMHPFASEIDDYAGYKRLRRLQREAMRRKGGSLQSELELGKIEMGMNAPSTTMLSTAPSTAGGSSAVGLTSALGIANLAKGRFSSLSPKRIPTTGSTTRHLPSRPPTFTERTPLIATRPQSPSLTPLSLHPGIPAPFSHDSPPATALKGAGMLGAPPLSRAPTDVSQRGFGGLLQRGVGTLHTASSVRSYTITMNRIPSVHDMQGKAYGIRDVAPWVDCDFEIPGKPLGGGGSGIRDVAPWVDHEIDGLAPEPRSPILPVSPGDVRQDAVLFSGSGSPATKGKGQGSPGKSLGSLGTETGSSPPTSEQREEQREKRGARRRWREVNREKKEKECERRGQPRSSRNNLARSLNPLAKLFDGAADTNPQTKYTVNPDLDRNPHPPLPQPGPKPPHPAPPAPSVTCPPRQAQEPASSPTASRPSARPSTRSQTRNGRSSSA